MATVRKGNKAVLVVVDTQVGVLAQCWEAQRVIGNVARAVERARAAGVLSGRWRALPGRRYDSGVPQPEEAL